MATWDDVRRLALALPETSEKPSYGGNASWTVGGKGFAWERPLGKGDRDALGASAPTGAILGVYAPDLETKAVLLAADPAVFFTTPHFDGYASVLIVLDAIAMTTLHEVLVESWLARAPKRVAAAYRASR
jgi:hypothetical protein